MTNDHSHCPFTTMVYIRYQMAKEEISTPWNGYCPESMLKGKSVRMRLNRSDFFESEETGLQICLLRGVQAVILNFRRQR